MRRRKKIFWTALLVLAIGWISVRFWLNHEVWKMYRASRPNPAWEENSCEWITFGIQKNASIAEVDRIIKAAGPAATSLEPHVGMRITPETSSPPWDGYISMYRFVYRGRWENPFIAENFEIYFDLSGKARSISRSLFQSVKTFPDKNDFCDVDLDTRTILPWLSWLRMYPPTPQSLPPSPPPSSTDRP
jgi:hypothetical protein